MAEHPNNSHAGMAGYLLGIGPMPPLRPQDIAVAQMQQALDRGVFEPGTQFTYAAQATQLRGSQVHQVTQERASSVYRSSCLNR